MKIEFKPFQSEETGHLVTALVSAQAEFPEITKSKRGGNKGGKSWHYADLPQILETIRPVLNKHGIAFTQGEEYFEGTVFLTTYLRHKETGQWIGSLKPLPTGISDQEYGSTISYQKRYSAMTILGICPSDEDLDNPDSVHESPQRNSNYYSSQTVSRSSLEELKSLTQGKDDLIQKILSYNKVNSLDELTSAQINSAVGALKRKS